MAQQDVPAVQLGQAPGAPADKPLSSAIRRRRRRKLARTAQLCDSSSRTPDGAPMLRLRGRPGRTLVENPVVHEFAEAAISDQPLPECSTGQYHSRLALLQPDPLARLVLSPGIAQGYVVHADVSETRQGACDLINCPPLDAADASHADNELLDLRRMDDAVVHADEIECLQVASPVSDLPNGAADVSLADREHLVHHHAILDECRQGASAVIECLLHADGVSHVDSELPVLHTADAPVAPHHLAESHGGESSLAQACDVDPPSNLPLYTWNIEGKRDLVDVSGDLDWDILCLQEVGDRFEAPGHILTRRSAGCRSAAIAIHHRLAPYFAASDDLVPFPLAWFVMWNMALTIVSVYLPHQRSTLASWSIAHAALVSQHAAIRQEHPQDVIMIGGDMNQDNLAATAVRALPQNRPSASAAELESVDTFLSWMRTVDLRLLCPTDGFQATWQQYGTEDDNHTWVLDYWCCSKNVQDWVHEIAVGT